MNRLKKPLWFVEAPAGGGEGGDGSGEGGAGGAGSQTFTQADVDRLVGQARIDERRKVSTKYADYDDLKAKADGAKTLEDRIAELEAKGTEAAQRALRAEIASEYGISTKRETGKDGKTMPSDADLFLTATDEDGLRKQAERLAGREAEQKRKGPRVPNEGKTPNPPADDPMRELARSLFGND